MNQPCSKHVNCACPDPVTLGCSAEGVDAVDFLATGFASVPPRLGNSTWDAFSCMAFQLSFESQEDADNRAEQFALACALGLDTANSTPPLCSQITPNPPPPPPTVYANTEQSSTVNCPDGLPFTITVQAGQFTASTQAAANALAVAYALQQANTYKLCLGPLIAQSGGDTNGNPQLLVPFVGNVTASGLGTASGNNTWSLTPGSTLPPGITFNASGSTGNPIAFTGTPMAAGTYTFGLTIVDAYNYTMTKTGYTMTVTCNQVYIAEDNFVINAPPNPVVSPGIPPAAPVIPSPPSPPLANPPFIQYKGPFVAQSPPADTAFSSYPPHTGLPAPPFGATVLVLEFTSPTLKTWYGYADFFVGSGTGDWDIYLQIIINGVVGDAIYVAGDFSFTTNNCEVTQLILAVNNENGNPGSAYVQWATPT
jgi:hypothetical protein